MDMSVKGEYALRAVFELCSRASPEPVKIAEIAARQGIPQKFLELILSQLKQGGFLASRRGAEGGYFLARPPESITVGEIIRHIDGPTAAARRREKGAAPPDSPFTELWEQVDQALSSVLDKMTFADLVSRWKEKKSAQVVNWAI
jgi:Rrf2 family protein